jgi:hypothetical protein
MAKSAQVLLFAHWESYATLEHIQSNGFVNAGDNWMKLTPLHYGLIVVGIILVIVVGVMLNSGGGGKPNLANDRDADTVLDADDACPDAPGVAPDGCLPDAAQATAEAGDDADATEEAVATEEAEPTAEATAD